MISELEVTISKFSVILQNETALAYQRINYFMKPVQVKINGHKQTFRSKSELARYLMDLLVHSVSTLSVRTQNLQGIMEMMGYSAKAKYLGSIWSEKIYEKAYWETVLSLENLGSLPGFSVICSIEKGNSNFSPEHKRISTDWTII